MREIRESCGHSQERLAEMAHLHRTYIGGIERGERNVSLLNIWRIAEALKIGPSELFAAPDGEATPAVSRSRGSASALKRKGR